MKKYYLLATALAALVSCSENEFIGDNNLGEANGQAPISFDLNTPAVTRAGGATAATLLANNFVVFGYKTVSSTPQTVFDNYQVNYVANTAHSTESNSAGWEYVSYKNLPYGTTTTLGGTLNTDGVAKNASGSSTNVEQSIKYWDFSATQYDFFAYSLGVGEPDDADADSDPQYAKVSELSNSTYALEGNTTQLGACYISNKKTMTSLSTSATQVDLEFLSFLSKIELKFYEIIPGYSVKTVKFYPSASGVSSTTPSLYAGSSVIPIGGKYTVTFDANGKPQLALETTTPAPTTDTKIDFSTTLTNYKDQDYKETSEEVYLGRASNDATSTNTITVLPNPDNTNALNLKMDFTLVSRDGTGETINMTGATAVIPAAYAKWKPNYKYTYIFKISDNTNAQTGSITGLYPITLDAVVADAQDGTQETITTVSDPSITTYAKGEMVTVKDEYLTGANIYIVVDNGTSLTVDTNAKLYTAEVEADAAQGITEESVKNAISENTDGGYDFGTVLAVETSLDGYYTYNSGTNEYSACAAEGKADGTTTYYKKVAYSVKDANGKKLIVKSAAGLSAITEIDATDAPDGKAITVNGAKFTTTAPTFEEQTVEVGTTVVTGWYTRSGAGTTESPYIYNKITAENTTAASGTTYYKKTATSAGYYVIEYTYDTDKKAYKVIKVVDKY